MRDYVSVTRGGWINTGVSSDACLDAVLRDPNRTSLFITDRCFTVLGRVLSQYKYSFTVALMRCLRMCDRVKQRGG